MEKGEKVLKILIAESKPVTKENVDKVKPNY